MEITQYDLDKLSDIFWWLKGYIYHKRDFDADDFNFQHADSLSKIIIFLKEQKEANKIEKTLTQYKKEKGESKCQ